MARIKTEGKVVSCSPSMVIAGKYYVEVETEKWGRVKYPSSKKREVGETVTLIDQRCRCLTDPIMWREE